MHRHPLILGPYNAAVSLIHVITQAQPSSAAALVPKCLGRNWSV